MENTMTDRAGAYDINACLGGRGRRVGIQQFCSGGPEVRTGGQQQKARISFGLGLGTWVMVMSYVLRHHHPQHASAHVGHVGRCPAAACTLPPVAQGGAATANDEAL